MNRQIRLLVFAAGAFFLSGIQLAMSAEPAPEKHYGYTDTPLLPGSPWHVHDSMRPLPPVVLPAAAVTNPPPSDAIVLFDGKDLSQWADVKDATITDGSFSIKQTGQIHTRLEFGDCQLHVEWATPEKSDGGPMEWGNSGIFLLGLYEIQIIQTDIYADGITGAIYGQKPPLVRAMRPAGEWQSYDIIFTAPRFYESKLVEPAYFTVVLNGVLVQSHQAALGPTRHRQLATYDNKTVRGPVMLQYHGSSVRFRNIWIRPLKSDE